MNLVSHYYFDNISGKPYFNFGLLLPDMMSIYKRNWRFSDKKFSCSLTPTESESIGGVLKHLELDSLFHQSDYFINYTGKIKKMMVSESLNYEKPRKHFISHILLELIIDKVIIKNNPVILERFFNDLALIEKKEIEALFKDTHTIIAEGFYLFLNKFRQKKFLYKYTEDHALVYVLNKVLERVKLPLLTAENEVKALVIIKDMTNYIEENFIDIEEIRSIPIF